MTPRIQRIKNVDQTLEIVFSVSLASKRNGISRFIIMHDGFQFVPIGSFGSKSWLGQHSITEQYADQLGLNAGGKNVILESVVPRSRGRAAIPEKLDTASIEQITH